MPLAKPWRKQPTFPILILLALGGLPWGGSHAQQERDGSFGFDGMRIFRFHRGVGPMAAGDLDGDGRTDLVVADNVRAEVVLLLQDPEAKGEKRDRSAADANDVGDPEGYRRRSLVVSIKVTAIGVHDLDRDGHLDLLLLGAPGALEVRWGGGERPFEESDRYRLREASGADEAIVFEEGSGGVEAFILAQKGIWRFHGFRRERAPQREMLPGTAPSPSGLALIDVDGDGRRDLLTISREKAFPYRLRLRAEGDDGAFGPELFLPGERPAAVIPMPGEGAGRLVAANIDRGRFDLLALRREARADPLDLPPPEILPLDARGLADPRLLVADVDGDGDPDAVVSDTRESTLRLFRNEGGKLIAAPPAPTVRSVRSLACGDLAGDGTPEIVVASADEKVVGASLVEGGSLTFPRVLGEIEAPLAAVPGRFLGGDRSGMQLAVLTKGRLSIHAGSGPAAPVKAAVKEAPAARRVTLELEGGGSDPDGLMAADLDGDGRDEILLFAPYQAPRIFRVVPHPTPRLEEIGTPGTLETASAPAVSACANGDLLVAAGNHCRRVRLRGGSAGVVHQLNGPTGSSRISCAVEARLEAGAGAFTVIIDRADESLTIFGAGEAQPRALRTLGGPYSDVMQAAAADLDGDGRDELLLLAPRFLALVRGGGRHWKFDPLFTYQDEEEKTRYVHGAGGDLDGDGRTDLVLSDGRNHMLQVFKPGQKDPWRRALRFPVYEAHRPGERGGSGPLEPRRVLVADLSGDGLDDVAILVHDRLIIYPQDGMP